MPINDFRPTVNPEPSVFPMVLGVLQPFLAKFFEEVVPARAFRPPFRSAKSLGTPKIGRFAAPQTRQAGNPPTMEISFVGGNHVSHGGT